ncbi:MAG: PD-(D/E)XK nuclease family protein, partial [Clostridia bacterium]|nr:PD-(D/E)XK nuclease family protein [Clostridia bacterium]
TFKKPLKFDDQAFDKEKLENFRTYICSMLESFDVSKLLYSLDVKSKLELHVQKLNDYGYFIDSDINEQIYDSVEKILVEMQEILGKSQIDYNEYRSIFLSGVSALELSVIPQYNDAVFIGAFKEASLTLSKHLFCMGLTSNVPLAKEDVAVLNDSDINALEKLKVLVEPKIRVINHRERQNVALGVSSFSENLYLSYPITDSDGRQSVKSQVISYLSNAFTLKPFGENNGYLTRKQAFNSFAKGCSDFSQGLVDDFTVPASFYHVADKELADKILQSANKQVKMRLDGGLKAVSGKITSPTAIEDYYKCPYRSFLLHGLNLKERKQGKPDGLSVGNVMHETLKYFLREIKNVTQDNLETVFEDIINKVLSSQEFSWLFDDPETENSISRTVLECKKYCRKTLEYYNRTDFKDVKTEVGFGDVKDAEFSAVELSNGKARISGRIDRIDTFGDYFRIIDYKTGSVDATDKALFTGNKLQLYLYAQAVNDKKPAGVYYLPISDDFSSDDADKDSIAVGKTLNDLEILKAQDNGVIENAFSEFTGAKVVGNQIKKATDSDTMQAFMDYAKKISEKAVQQIDDGIIVASPYKNACSYCAFKAMCNQVNPKEREVSSVTEQTIYDSVKGEEECPN